MKRVFPASCGRPDNSWAAAKTVAGSNFTGAGHVTWLLLTTSDTYSRAHVWTQLLWEPRQRGGCSWLDAKSRDELLVYEVSRIT